MVRSYLGPFGAQGSERSGSARRNLHQLWFNCHTIAPIKTLSLGRPLHLTAWRSMWTASGPHILVGSRQKVLGVQGMLNGTPRDEHEGGLTRIDVGSIE